jgi:hypothetical protein
MAGWLVESLVCLEYFAGPRDWVLWGRCCNDRSVIVDRGKMTAGLQL